MEFNQVQEFTLEQQIELLQQENAELRENFNAKLKENAELRDRLDKAFAKINLLENDLQKKGII